MGLLKEKGIVMNPVNFAQKAYDEILYPNARTEMFLEAAQEIKNGFWVPEEAKVEFLAMQVAIDHRGRQALLPKELAKKILGQDVEFSTDIIEIGGECNKEHFAEIIEQARMAQDSVGGVVECCVKGIKVGLGEPFFDSAESLIAHLLFSVPAVKGVEFGAGFEAARKRGSQNNDCIISADGKTATNHAGGIVGGITNGNDIVVRAAIKPTASISSEQQTFNFETGAVEPLVIKGRHDVCIALRAAVVVESAIAIALAELKLRA
jgi:chorismate synthase